MKAWRDVDMEGLHWGFTLGPRRGVVFLGHHVYCFVWWSR